MANDSIKLCDHAGSSNLLMPSIQSELQGLFSRISKAAHAFFNHPLGLKIPCLLLCGGLHPLTSLAAAVMALALLPAAPAVATEATLYVFPETGRQITIRPGPCAEMQKAFSMARPFLAAPTIRVTFSS
jgi:hypothetical protein